MILAALVDWHPLARASDLLKLTHGGCEWVSFESIAGCLARGESEDLTRPNTVESNHAARIASLVRLAQAGVALDALRLHVLPAVAVAHAPRRRLEAWFEDGSHRFRAYQFLGSLEALEVELSGEPEVLTDLLNVAGESLTPVGALHLAHVG